ncbi:MAG: cytochrome c biogenesis protein CcsA [Fimbriiglobus sp.]
MSTITPEIASTTKPVRQRGFLDYVVMLLKPIASLRLTVTLFALSTILIFFGTVAQKNSGIWSVVDQYFWSMWVAIDLQLVIQFFNVFSPMQSEIVTKAWVPFPAGKTIGFAMFFNLLAAHTIQLINLIRVTKKQAKKEDAVREVFRVLLKRSGIYILHGGLLLLFVGEYITREFQVEQNMVITEGSSTDYAFDTRNYEIAFATDNPAEANSEIVTVVPVNLLRSQRGMLFQHENLPVDLKLLDYYPNSDIVNADELNPTKATAGRSPEAAVISRPEVSGTDPNQKFDMPSGYLEVLKKGASESLGIFKISVFLSAQSLLLDGKTYHFELRNTRHYKPFALYLRDFRFDRLPGTDKAKNYSSDVTILDPERGLDREEQISMNNPLRYRGEAFFQSSFLKDEKSTILQVVRNPGYVLPYVSCALVTFGLCLHFILALISFMKSGSQKVAKVAENAKTPLWSSRISLPYVDQTMSTAKTLKGIMMIPLVFASLSGLSILATAFPRTPSSTYDLETFGSIPVLKNGRHMPLDTSARVNLRLITNKEEYTDYDDKTLPAVQWYLECASQGLETGSAAHLEIFRIENDRLTEMMKVKRRKSLRYSYAEMIPAIETLSKTAEAAAERAKINKNTQDLFDVKATELSRHIQLFRSVAAGDDAAVLRPKEGSTEWRKPKDIEAEVLQELIFVVSQSKLPPNPRVWTKEQEELVQLTRLQIREKYLQDDEPLKQWDSLMAAYKAREPQKFNKLVKEYAEANRNALPAGETNKLDLEYYLNRTAFYYLCIALYFVAFALTIASLPTMIFKMSTAEGLRRAAFTVLIIGFGVNLATLLLRMYLMERPLVFVTNLYSSAVFIGCVGVMGCLVIEKLFSLGIGNLIGSAVGFGTAIIAHNLALGEDVLEPLQAVLDTNFWLATHVTTVTWGYAATFVAGTIGIIYVVTGFLTPYLNVKLPMKLGNQGKEMELGRILGMILYAVVCFGVLFSFVGTVLGGIWADQSWGRFWGWDPKENGAVMIVLWNALILHARWSGMVKDRGMATLSIVGNMITAWSWFGTNQLGVGLHAYGFSETLRNYCNFIWLSHLCLLVTCLVPKKFWGSKLPE